eukprot:SAG11_NODE_24646_length_370_cov_0.760148_1_plen_83_part_01
MSGSVVGDTNMQAGRHLGQHNCTAAGTRLQSLHGVLAPQSAQSSPSAPAPLPALQAPTVALMAQMNAVPVPTVVPPIELIRQG